MIEVEIRGALTKEKFEELNQVFSEKGNLLETQDREMIILQDTPNYDPDPTKRVVDIRIRQTNGDTEIMVKHKKSEGNVARSEKAYPMGKISLDAAKEFVSFFGSKKGQWMHRKKKVYDHLGGHWSLVEAVPDIFYYELEKEIADYSKESDIAKTIADLEVLAKSLKLQVFTIQESGDFIKMLVAKVNKNITW